MDIIIEFGDIIAILSNSIEYTKGGMSFIMYNSNVWALLLLTGLLSCVVLSLKKFNLFYYLSMIHLLLMIILSSSSTATFVGFAVILLYTVYEIVSHFSGNKKKTIITLSIYLGGLIVIFGFMTLLDIFNAPFMESIISFIKNNILFKDYNTVASRKEIWASVYHLLKSRPIDFIFGCGYKTGNIIFANFYEIIDYGFAARSAHNGLFEIFLRHGVVGLLFYVAAFVPFLLGIIKSFKQKQYRFAFIHTLCMLGIFGHSVSESTILFTPNIEGMYMTIVFYLPVVNILKQKYFDELEKEVNENKQEVVAFSKEKVIYFVQVIILGSIIALATTLILKGFVNNTSALIAYIIGITALLLAFILIPLIIKIIDKKPLKEEISAYVISPIKHHYIAILLTIGIGVLGAFVLPLIFTFDLFSYLLFTLFVFVFYNFALLLLDEKNKYLLFSYFDNRFAILLRNKNYEVTQ